MASSGRVVVVGSLNVDSTSYVAAFPEPGETILSHGFQVALGGKGSNQAVAAHVVGASVDFVARIGTDAAGDFALSTLEGFGLPTDAVARVADAPTGVAQITVADSGENTIIVTGGANLALTPDAAEAEGERIAGGRPGAHAGRAAGGHDRPRRDPRRTGAACASCSTSLRRPRCGAGTLRSADPLVVNEHEARAVGIGTDAAGTSLDAWRELAASAVGRIARSVVVTLGSAGAVAASAEASWTAEAPRVDAVDTTGAGDGFTGALAAFLAEGRPLDEALRFAVAAGALAVQARGTVDSYAPRDAVLRLAGLEEGPGTA